MKKAAFVTGVLVLCFAFLGAGQEIAIKEMQPFSYACMAFGGSFDKMEQAVTTFIGEFFKQGLTPIGPVLGIYYNDPTVTKEEELKWSVGFPVVDNAEMKEPLKKMQFTAKEAAVYLYIGPYEKMDKTYEMMLKFIAEKGYKMVWPSYEKYLNNPQEVKPEELQTEIIIPIVKK